MGAGRLEPVRTGRRADHLLDATRKALGAAGSSAILRADVTTIDGQRGRGEGAPEVGVSGAALDAVAEASRALTEGRTLHEALAAIASFLVPKGITAAVLAAGWFVVCAVAGVAGLTELLPSRSVALGRLLPAAVRTDLEERRR